MISRADLTDLLSAQEGPKVSLYMPRHIGSRETRQDPARLKNLLVQAESKLAEIGIRPDEAERVLQPVRNLVSDEAFWREQAHGLAVFAGSEGLCHFNLDDEVGEHVCAGRAYHLFPLLAMLERDRPFLVLTISRNRARLYRASGGTLHAVEADLPSGVQTVIDRTDYDGENTPEDYRKAELIQYFREVSHAVEMHAKREHLPIVLIALPETQGNFRALGNHPDLLYVGVHENPDALTEQQLFTRAAAAVEPLNVAATKALAERVGATLSSSRGSSEIDEIIAAAESGRIDILVLSDLAEPQLEGSVLDQAISLSFRNGGQVRILPQFLMPTAAPAAAIFRY